MRQHTAGLSVKQMLIAALCILAAVSLLIVALMEPKQPQGEQWTPLNDEVERTLIAMDNGEGKAATGKLDGGKGSKDVKDANDAEEAGIVKESVGNVSKAEVQEKNESANEKADLVNEESSLQEESDASDNKKLDINRATAAELDLLKGIGPAKAQAIIADREKNGFFKSIDELLRVKGIGNKLLAGIEENIVVRP